MNASSSNPPPSPPPPIAPRVVTASAIVWLLCIVGIVLNALLVFVTVKSKSLRTRCNLLIAFNSLAAIPTLWGISFKFFLLLSGTNFISLRSCYAIQLVALIGGPLLSTSLLCIGVDRLISIAFPIWYKNSDKFKSFWLLIACCVVRAAYRNYLYAYVMSLYPEKLVMCSPGDMNQAEIGTFIYQEGLFVYWADLLCYVLMWVLVLFRRKSIQDWAVVKKLLLSLTVIMAITLFGSIQAQVYRVLLRFTRFESADSDYLVSLLSSCLYAISDSSNTPVLLIFSKEYRKAFGDTLPKVRRLRCPVRLVFVSPLAKIEPNAIQRRSQRGQVVSSTVGGAKPNGGGGGGGQGQRT